MKHIILIALLCLNLSCVIAQSEGKKVTYVYKTYEDMLSRKNGLERNYFPLFTQPDVLEYPVEGSKKKKKFKIKDSLSYYVGYESIYGIRLIARNYYDQKLEHFASVLGGDKNYFMATQGKRENIKYYSDGYAETVSADQFFNWYFVKMEGDKQVYIYNILDIIKDDAELMKQYDAEFVKVNNVRVARENDFKSDMKYLRLFTQKHQTK